MEINQSSKQDKLQNESLQPSNMNKFVRSLIYVLVTGLLLVVGIRLVKVQAGQISSGKAPDFTITNFSGETITLSDLEGNVVVVNFWASWCPPCREEAAYLEATWRKYQDQGVIFIGVDYADTETEAMAYLEEFDITYFNGPDLGTKISQAYNMQGVPETFVIDQNGAIRNVHIGPLYYPTLDEMIDALLQE
jgi:cytochrome c biogenesis protein CcmG/thiol:disulfide interchange protein DsbE